jgi:hypothetical protein
MGSNRRVALCCVALLGFWTGCSGSSDGSSGSGSTVMLGDGGASQHKCIDKDDDGFGRYCDLGEDCDDSDPDMTDACYRCAQDPAGCECDAGVEPKFCTPAEKHVDGGILVCQEGTRYCRKQPDAGTWEWSDCNAIGDYVFQAN